MPREKKHHLNRYVVVDDEDFKRCHSIAKAIVCAVNDHSQSAQQDVLREAIQFARVLRCYNDSKMIASPEAMVIGHLARIRALSTVLREAGVKSPDVNANAVTQLGFQSYLLPKSLNLPSILEHWGCHAFLTWQHWVALTRVCKLGAFEYPLVYRPYTHEQIFRSRSHLPPIRDPKMGDLTIQTNFVVAIIREYQERANIILESSVADSLTPETIVRRRSRFIQATKHINNSLDQLSEIDASGDYNHANDVNKTCRYLSGFRWRRLGLEDQSSM